jgi:AcrR family transcriptional regulator
MRAHAAAKAGNDNPEKPGAGRPRSEPSRKAIIDATRRLLTHAPLARLSIEAIAKKAGVGKTTIYRWWPNKGAIALEALLGQPVIQNAIPEDAASGEAIVRHLENLIRLLRGQNGRIIAGLIAESQSDEAVLDLLYEKFLRSRVETLYGLVERGRKDGVLKDGIDTAIAIDMLLGPIFMRVLSGPHGIDSAFAENYPQQALLALRA